MSRDLRIYNNTFTNVKGFKAKGTDNSTLYYPGSSVNDHWVRPADWPPLTDINISNEECIFLTYDNSDHDPKNWIGVGATVTGGCTYELGHIENKQWVCDETLSTGAGSYKAALPSGIDYPVFKMYPTTSGNHITAADFSREPSYLFDPTLSANSAFQSAVPYQKCIERYANLPYIVTLSQKNANSQWHTNYLVSDTQLNFQSVTDLKSKYNGAGSLQNLMIFKLGSGVTTLEYMLQSCSKLKWCNYKDWNITSSCTTIKGCFYQCGLKEIDLRSWNLSGIGSGGFEQAFYGASAKHIYIGTYDYETSRSLKNMFQSNMALQESPINNIDFTNVTDITSIIAGCSFMGGKVILKNISAIPASTFQNCSYISEFIFDVESVPTLANTNAFYRCHNDYKIKFPASLVDEAKSETNWSTLANKIEAIEET